MNPDHVEWCRKLFTGLRVGGVWGIPVCGLIFTKIDDKTFSLTAAMPHDKAMPCTAEELKMRQDDMYRQTRQHFAAAGIDVTRGIPW